MINRRLKNTLFMLFILPVFIAFLLLPSIVSNSVRSALSLCFSSVIPSLFPFLVLTKLISFLNPTSSRKNFLSSFSERFFAVGTKALPALFLGLISGYPIGVSVCCSLYKTGSVSRREAERLLSFCNNAGPAFILSTVGIGIFSSLKIGVLLLLIHIASALCVALLFQLFSPIKLPETSICKEAHQKSFSSSFTDSIYSALMSSLTISAYVVFFSVINSVLSHYLHSIPSAISAFISGILEITSGSFKIASIVPPEISFVVISFFLGFGGMCVHFQALSFINETDLKTREYFIGKILHGIISCILALIVSKTGFFKEIAVFSGEHTSPTSFAFILPFTVFLITFSVFFKKGWKTTKF